MKKIILLGLMSLLGGCAATNDLINNQYMEIQPTDSPITGNWTGNNGPYLVTYRFNEDGTGLSCYSYGATNTVERFKVNGKTLILQTGIKQTIEEYSEHSLTLKANYYGGAKYNYKPDPELLMASPYCGRELKK
ncbi:J517_1871 family lipoprotein [Acinetobacter baumannii]|uniref:J517_1871 family lipoprotein n=1 Tax=Acinetobacter baumannii TaxID=470 RepID=UPI003D088CCB